MLQLIPPSFIHSENLIFHDGLYSLHTHLQKKIDQNTGQTGLVYRLVHAGRICSIFLCYLPAITQIPGIAVLLVQECLAALLPWTPSVAAPQGR